MLKPVNVNHKLSFYGNLQLTIKWIQIYVEVWKLYILVLPNQYFENMKENVFKKPVKDPLWRIVNPKFVMLRQIKCCGSGNFLIYVSLSLCLFSFFFKDTSANLTQQGDKRENRAMGKLDSGGK